jgi:radical SAM-linked protein
VAKPVPPTVSLPAAQYLLVRYAKRGKMRFASHRDVARAFERGVRRAGLPIAFSAGFSPHPKISYAGGAPTGVASEAEYLTIAMTSPQAADQVRERLDAVLPDGIDVLEVTEDAKGSAGEPQASEWRVVLPGVRPEAAAQAVTGFLALSHAPVERRTDKGVRQLDARTAVTELAVLEDAVPDPAGPDAQSGPLLGDQSAPRRGAMTSQQDCAILRMVVLHQVPAVRPEDVLTALSAGQGLVPSSPPLTTRLSQYWPTLSNPTISNTELGSSGAPNGKTVS